jgi:hypothetical protein
VSRGPEAAAMLKVYSSPLPLQSLPAIDCVTSTVYSGVGGVSEFNMHPYIDHFDGKFWCMWSLGPLDEDREFQRIWYATSDDGESWSSPAALSPVVPNGMRHIARGFWIRDGVLLGLYSEDEFNQGYFGDSLKLFTVAWSGSSWGDPFLVADNTISNYPPMPLPGGQWMFSRRNSGNVVSFIRGDIGSWNDTPVPNPRGASLSEPTCTRLDNGVICAVFRSDTLGTTLYRSYSRDGGKTWAPALPANFPDARSKHAILRLSDGRFIICSNPATDLSRTKLVIGVSGNGVSFDKFYMLRGEPTTPRWFKSQRRIGYQYPHLIERGDFVYAAYSTNKEDIEVSRFPVSGL